jgi:hypothetical protein
MIVFSPALVLTAQQQIDENRPIICYENHVSVSNLVADQEDADYPATNLANPLTTSLWKSGSTSDQYLTVTLSGADEVDYVGIARHNFGSGAVIVSVEAITDEPGAVWEEVIDEQDLGDDRPALFVFEADHYVGVRLKLQPDAVEPQAAVMYLGRSLRMPKGLQPGHVPMPYARTRETLNGSSMNGEFTGSIVISQRLASSAIFKAIDGAWYRESMQPFVEVCRDPFFFAWRPVAFPSEVAYAWALSDPQPVQNYFRSDLVDISLDLGGLAL